MPAGTPAPPALALALIWSADEPERVGEVAVVPPTRSGSFTLGRADRSSEDGALPLTLHRLRPFAAEDRGPFESARVSRRQLRLRVEPGGTLTVDAPGRGELRVNDHPTLRATKRPGDVVEVVGRFLLRVTERPVTWPREETYSPAFPFAAADTFGIVGESLAAWQLRRQIAFLGDIDEHVLVFGPSGAGKELAVQAIHARSRRSSWTLISRNAAAFPEGLIDAELFGNLKNYPNPGTPERPGLLGEADPSSLFLDEIGELPHALQARMLRVMDCGEYQRLGEARPRATRARVLAATNRDPSELKHDLLARFPHRLRLPALEERAEDIALLARHLVRGFAEASPAQVGRFIVEGQPRFSARLISALTRRTYRAQTRELAEILWRSIGCSPGSELDAPPDVVAPFVPPPEPGSTDPRELSREQIVAALARCGGVRDRAWRELNLRNRDQLKRLLKKYAIT